MSCLNSRKTSLSVPPLRQISCGHDRKCFLCPGFFIFLRRKARGSIDRCRGDTLVTSAASMRASSQQQQQQQHVPLSRITGISSRPRAPPPGVSTTGAGSRNVRLITHSVSTVQSVKIPVKMGIVSLDRRTLDAQFSAGKCPNQIVEMNFLTFKLMNFQV